MTLLPRCSQEQYVSSSAALATKVYNAMVDCCSYWFRQQSGRYCRRNNDYSTKALSGRCRGWRTRRRPLIVAVYVAAASPWLSLLDRCAVFCAAFSSASSSNSRRPTSKIYPKQQEKQQQQLLLYGGNDEETNEKQQEYLIQIGRQQLQGLYTSFALDDWQLLAGGAIWEGYNVIVSAPTGAGKTVVGEMALHVAFQQQQHKSGIYTTPLKALSNQKYAELAGIFGRSNTGLSTGDISINKGARITVMTTEVYRNIAWRSSSPGGGGEGATATTFNKNELQDNAVVVLDEFHYMGNPGRGGVWEESVITSPSHTQIVALSATLSNAPSLALWMESVTNRTTILVQVPNSQRPVPLRYLFATKDGLYPLFRDPDAGPGAPKGLLGYRGDGIIDTNNIKTRIKQGFAASEDHNPHSTKLPKGLHVNPALRDAAARRLQKIELAIQRQKARSRRGGGGGGTSSSYDPWDDEPNPRQQVYRSAKKLTAKEERKERERLLKKEMRRAVPSMHALIMRLDQKNMLPAIFFIFSRMGCDEAARAVSRQMKGQHDLLQSGTDGDDTETTLDRKNTKSRPPKRLLRDSNGRSFRPGSNFASDELILASLYDDDATAILEKKEASLNDADSTLSSLMSDGNCKYYANFGLLGYKDVCEVASRISAFNEANQEIAFDDDLIEQYLLGVGSHHAGMLPAHKSFVESLFRNQLMKVVFATETLAAGINMPARTTVICSMAKKANGGGAVNLLETSNLLQMAGRAGRRGMDTDGTCVIVATPFESHDDAAKILTDPVAPISSQFSPSYSLCINLIARGDGELAVAKQLVSKSFAMWERRQVQEEESIVDVTDDTVSDALLMAAQDRFINVLIEILQTTKANQPSEKVQADDTADFSEILDVLCEQKSLKKASKSYVASTKTLELEITTLGYLETELTDRLTIDDDTEDILKQIDIQRKRATMTEWEVNNHPFTAIATIVSNFLAEGRTEGRILADSLRSARGIDSRDEILTNLSPDELSTFAKSAVKLRRKSRKLEKTRSGTISKALVEAAEGFDDNVEDSWDDFLSIARTLLAYGCLSTDRPVGRGDYLEGAKFELSPAGLNIGMLGFENSLWALAAMGGAWDVKGASSKLDEFRDAMSAFESDEANPSTVRMSPNADDILSTSAFKAQQEADALVSLLKKMSPSELAGYVSCLIFDNSRGGGPPIVELYQRITPLQQQVVAKALLSLERLTEVQKQFMVDDATLTCNFDISSCEVVTAWAEGCSWSEALLISGCPPGDLARILSRVLDAVRQFGNLPFSPVRRNDLDTYQLKPLCRGLDPDIRRLCRDASRMLNRYPIKDPLAFATTEDEDIDPPFEEDGDVVD